MYVQVKQDRENNKKNIYIFFLYYLVSKWSEISTQISILQLFLTDHMTLKTELMMAENSRQKINKYI